MTFCWHTPVSMKNLFQFDAEFLQNSSMELQVTCETSMQATMQATKTQGSNEATETHEPKHSKWNVATKTPWQKQKQADKVFGVIVTT